MLVNEAKRLQQLGGGLYFCNLKPLVYDKIVRSGFINKIGNDHFFDQKRNAIRRIYKKLDRDICASCSARVFDECV
jgi:SulP family sulfate permease